MFERFLQENEAFAQQVELFRAGIHARTLHDRIRILQALQYMVIFQHDQKPRADGKPYPYHPLAVAFGVLDRSADEIVAALLHDIVEDQAEKIASPESKDKRIGALDVLEIRFGTHVRFLIEQLTNPDFDGLIIARGLRWNNREEQRELKRKLYCLHIQIAIRNDEVARIKLFDFCENALTLDQVKSEKVRLGLRKKYLPVAQLFLERIPMLSLEISLQEEIQGKLERFLLEEG